MLHVCTYCDQTFESHSKKANHIRWKHVRPEYTPEGLEGIRENIRSLNAKRKAAGEWVVEDRVCPCGKTFQARYKTNHAFKGRTTCTVGCAHKGLIVSDETKQRRKESYRRWIKENPEKFAEDQTRRNENNTRTSSKPERALAELLKPEGFSRARVIRTPELNFAVDLMSPCGKIWIESDGPYHFEKVHKNHDFDKTKRRDELQENEALRRNVLLIRVNNGKFSIQEQVEFIRNSIMQWDLTGAVKKLY